MAWLYFVVLAIYIIHSFIDFVCSIAVLFCVEYIEIHTEADLSENSSAVTNNNTTNKNDSGINIWKNWIRELYPSMFKPPGIEVYPPIFCRVLMYWIAAMSLVRVVAICWTCTPTLITVAVMYAFEALAIEYEGSTFHTARSEYARKASLFSIGMCIISCLMAIAA
jgi:hypothetical protein